MRRPSRGWTVATLALAGCAATTGVGPVTVRQDLPPAARAVGGSVTPVAGGGPVVVSLGSARDEAEAAARRLVDAMARGDEDALRALLADTVEGTEGERCEGREQVLTLVRPWLAHLARVGTPPSGTAARVLAPEECARGACGTTFLRRGDWFVALPTAGLRAPPSLAPPRPLRGGPFALGGSTAAPPRFVVLRPVDGAMRVVAVNDDLLRGR